MTDLRGGKCLYPYRNPPKRVLLARLAARMRAYNLTHGSGCKSRLRVRNEMTNAEFLRGRGWQLHGNWWMKRGWRMLEREAVAVEDLTFHVWGEIPRFEDATVAECRLVSRKIKQARAIAQRGKQWLK